MYIEYNDYKIQIIKNGPLQNNSYVIIKGTDAVIIDPASKVCSTEIARQGLTVQAVLLTHGHFDHIKGVAPFLSSGVSVYIHEADNAKCNGNFMSERLTQFRIEPFDATDFVDDDEVLELIGLEIKVMHTPGHSSGSVCYILGDIIFSGDTIFEQSYGRYDFEDGSLSQLKNSIIGKVFELEGDYRILTGHGEDTTLSNERKGNMILWS